MALHKRGSAVKIKVVKNASFTVDSNYLSEIFLKQWPEKKVSVDQIHSALKSVGIINYGSDDLSILMNRLQAIGFTISK